MTDDSAEIDRLTAAVEALSQERDGLAAQCRGLEKQARFQARAMRRLEHNARKRSEVSERNRAMMVRGNEVLAAEIERCGEIEAQLRVAMDKACDATLAKSEFLANMSHELRTPMNGVLGMLELAMDASLSPDVNDLLRTAEVSARELLVLLNDILDFSKIEARALTLEAVPFSPWDAADDALAVVGPAALARGLDLRLHGAESVPAEVLGDPVRYRQILKNLLSNAIKFTEAGFVEVAFSYDGDHLTTTVRDTGGGISLERQEAIFQPFTQADASTTRKYGGTGLGLAIVRQLVTLMGGELRLESELGRGTDFVFSARLPVHQQDWTPTPELAGQRVGIWAGWPADSVLIAALKSVGCEVVEASNMTQGQSDSLDVVIRCARGEPLDGVREVLVLDSGDELTIDHRLILRRPIRRTAVASVLSRVLGHRRPTQRPTAVAPKGGLVLVAEDNVVNQLLTRKMLERLGYTPTIVGNGQEAVDATLARRFDIVLMDCQMPVLDGYAATEKILSLAGPKAKPVIVALTAHALDGDRARCLRAGMHDYLSKPLGLGDLESCLNRWMRRRPHSDLHHHCCAETDSSFTE